MGNKYQTIPSQFAIFAINELITLKINDLTEYGCGAGKDAIFFSLNGINVTAYDKSLSAIKHAKMRSESLSNTPKFIHITDFNDIKQPKRTKNHNICIYTRFFLHALDDSLIKSFFHYLNNTCIKGDVFMSEFRIIGDNDGQKETSDHFRNYINPSEFINILESANFKVLYSIKGTGMAKFKRDDALVMRIIAKMN